MPYEPAAALLLLSKAADDLIVVALMIDNGIDAPTVLEQVPTLTPFAVVYRYEDLDLGDEPDLSQLRHLVREVHAWATAVVDSAVS